MNDVILQPQVGVLVHGKGRRKRCLPLWKTTTTALRAWLTIRGTTRVPELFLSTRGEPMSRSGFEYTLRRHVQTAAKSCPSLATQS
jgi:integrase/recombinase XerD